MGKIFKENKKELKKLACEVLLKKLSFNIRLSAMISLFNLKRKKRRKLFFGGLGRNDASLNKYFAIINSDPELNSLYDEIKGLTLAGNMLIVRLLKNKDVSISGYNLDLFINSPAENSEEINDLILGIGDYRHIHIIAERIAIEIPARKYFNKHSEIVRLTDYWLKKIQAFAKETWSCEEWKAN